MLETMTTTINILRRVEIPILINSYIRLEVPNGLPTKQMFSVGLLDKDCLHTSLGYAPE